MKRILLFLVTNLAVILVLSVAARLLGIDRYLGVHGGDDVDEHADGEEALDRRAVGAAWRDPHRCGR